MDYTDIFQVLNNPTTRRMVDAIEDTLASLRDYNMQEPILQEVLNNQISRLQNACGYKYIVH